MRKKKNNNGEVQMHLDGRGFPGPATEIRTSVIDIQILSDDGILNRYYNYIHLYNFIEV